MNLNHSLHNQNPIRHLNPLLTVLLILSLTWLALLCWTSAAWADSGVIKGSVVNIRSGPGTSHEIVGTVYEGTEVTISQQQGDWYKVTLGNTTGWVSSSLVTVQITTKVTVTGTTVNLRSGPGTSYDVVGQVSQGDTLTLLSTEGDWYKVKTTNGNVCYIAASLAGKTDSGSSAPSQTAPAKPAPSGKQVQVVSGPINVRSGPGTDHDKVGSIPDQGVFSVVDTQGDWHKIRLTNGTDAWVAAWLVKEVTGTSTTPTTPTPSTPSTGTPTTPVVNLDGKRLNFEVDPIIENDRTLVPLRAIFEAIGAHVEWDAAANTVTAARDGIKVVLAIGSTQPTVDGKIWPLDVPAKIVKDRTLAPLRFVGEAFGGQVGWDQATYTVTMTSPSSKGTPTSVIVNYAPVNLRSGPNSTYGQVAMAEPGEKLSVVGERDGWYEVSRGGTRGWVASWVVDVAWEANEPISDPSLPPVNEAPETPPPTKPDKPGEDVIWLSCEKDETGYTIGIESGSKIDAKIKERSSEVVYTIRDREVEGKYLFEETLGTSKLTIRGTQDGDDAIVTITFPTGTEYRTASDRGGKKELLVISNFIQKVDRKAFSTNGERLIITTALPVKYSAQQKGDRLEVTLEGVVLGKADDKYTFKDSELIDSVRFEDKKDSTLITVNTNDLGKYSLGLGGSLGNEFNIMLVNKSAVKARQDNLVVIDPGHGGKDTGARGSKVDEKELNLQVSTMVGEILEKNGIDVAYTRDDDSTVDLEVRSQIANDLNAGLFVSIHHNSTTSSDKAGTETYFYAPPENPTLFMQKDERQKLASEIHKRLIKNLRRTDRGVKQANFSVLRNTQMPSVLAEICFISNPEEQNLAMKKTFQELAAEAIADGILAYMGK